MQSKSGYKTFLAGAIALIVFGAMHLLAVYNANFREPTDPKMAEISAAAKAHIIELGPFTPSAWGTMQILNGSYSVLLIYAGVLNLSVMRVAAQAGRLKGLTVCNIFFVALLLLITIIFQFPPPMLFAGIALTLFSASWAKQRSVIR